MLLSNVMETSNSNIDNFSVLLEEYGWIIIYSFVLIFAWVAGYLHSMNKKRA